MVKSVILGLLSLKLILALTVFNIPAKVHAGVFSFVYDVFYVGKDINTDLNSQNMALLRSSMTSSYDFQDTSGGIKIVSDAGGDALSPTATRAGAVLGESTSRSQRLGMGGGMVVTHRVKENETVSSIAEEYNISVNTILWENGLSRESTLRVGQELRILPFTGVRHKVSSGDTLSEIAEQYDISLKEIADFNRFSPDDILIPGNHINIPGGEKRPVTSSQTQSTSRASAPTTSSSQATSQPMNVSGYFRAPLDNYRVTQGWHNYNAVDFAPARGGQGAPILAAADGVVAESATGWNGGYGNLVVIRHPNGTRTLYAHNRVNYVSVGESVVQGQMIAEVGNTGISTGPHVHFEVHGASNPFAR